MINPDNPVALLAAAVTRICGYDGGGDILTTTTTAMFDTLRRILNLPHATHEDLIARLGPLERMVRAGVTNTVNPTQLTAGYKTNVVPADRDRDDRRPLLAGRTEQIPQSTERPCG